MRTTTITVLLALLAVAVLASACPRDKGEQTNVSIEQEVPADGTVVADGDGDGAAGETNVDVDVDASSEGGEAAAEGEQAEGDAAAGETANGDAAAGEGDTAGDTSEDKPAEPAKEDGLTKVVLETSKGDIVIAVHPEWAPKGAARFLELVNAGYYNGAPWFRVMEGFMAQTGIAADPAVTAQWQDKRIPDDPVVKGNTRGTVSFGTSGPNSRSTHIFINKVDNTAGLDRQGFSAFGEVVEGMDVVDNLKITGDRTVDQGILSERGIEYFKEVVPGGDVIIRAYVQK